MTDTDLVAQLRARLEAQEKQAAEQIEALQRRVQDREEYARLSGAGYAKANADREAAERAEQARLGPEFSREQLRDPEFFQAHKSEIETAVRRGRITGIVGLAQSSPAREAIRAQMRKDGML